MKQFLKLKLEKIMNNHIEFDLASLKCIFNTELLKYESIFKDINLNTKT